MIGLTGLLSLVGLHSLQLWEDQESALACACSAYTQLRSHYTWMLADVWQSPLSQADQP